MDDETLRQAYGRIIARTGSTGRRGCPEPERILGLAERTDPESIRLETLDHAMACPECRRELDLVRAVAEGGELAAAPARTRFPLPRFAVAASIVLLAGGALTVWNVQLRSTLPPAFRGADAVAPASPTDEVETGVSTTFAWHPADGAVEYRVELFDDGGLVLDSAATPDTTVSIVVPPLPSGTQLYWSVQATLRSGEAVRSPAVSLRVR
ncbi:MAG TPA: hypothetical protein VK858_21915 [Longimicrobiales bacterium]|nr:hypothetical protein [Longimicrobiales bacterium]